MNRRQHMRLMVLQWSVVALLLSFVGAIAQQSSPAKYEFGLVVTSLKAVTTTGIGVAFAVPDSNGIQPGTITWTVNFALATPTSQSTNLEGSLDNAQWDVIDTNTATASGSRVVVNRPYKFFRCNNTAYAPNGSNLTCKFLVSLK